MEPIIESAPKVIVVSTKSDLKGEEGYKSYVLDEFAGFATWTIKQ